MDKIFNMDCLEGLKTLPDNSIDCCVTSPPYYGLRSYQSEGQYGLEETFIDYVNKMTEVFNEVKRVLKPTGTLWLNLGDSYAGSNGNGYKQSIAKTNGAYGSEDNYSLNKIQKKKELLPKKNLIGIPWRVAFSLQDNGWILRNDIIWNKPNSCPESVKDRCTRAHEYIFLMTKCPKYYFDYESILEPFVNNKIPKGAPTTVKERLELGIDRQPDTFGAPVDENGTNVISGSRSWRPPANAGNPKGKHKRDVWTVPVKPCREAHFATFSPELITPCLLAGCPEGGVVLDPFMGAGTTALVAKRNNRHYVGFELNPEYIEICNRRLNDNK